MGRQGIRSEKLYEARLNLWGYGPDGTDIDWSTASWNRDSLLLHECKMRGAPIPAGQRRVIEVSLNNYDWMIISGCGEFGQDDFEFYGFAFLPNYKSLDSYRSHYKSPEMNALIFLTTDDIKASWHYMHSVRMAWFKATSDPYMILSAAGDVTAGLCMKPGTVDLESNDWMIINEASE